MRLTNLIHGGNNLNIENIQGEGRIINVVEELQGKEVIDGSGKLVGIVKDILWDFKSNKIVTLMVEEQGSSFLSRIRSGEKQFIPYERIHSIEDKLLVDAKFEENCYEFKMDRYSLEI